MANPTATGAALQHRLLIADDEEVIRIRLKEFGERLGLQVSTARDGIEACQIFEAEQPGLVFLDIYMPRMNGLIALREMKKTNPQSTIVLMTGFMHYKQLIEKEDIKPDGFLSKPFNFENLANVIQGFLKKNAVATTPRQTQEDVTFVKCPKCQKSWRKLEDLIRDANVELAEYLVNYESIHGGQYLFKHKDPACNMTFSVPLTKFLELYKGEVSKTKNLGTPQCPGFCFQKESLEPCLLDCEYAFTRDIVQIICKGTKTPAQ
ncbi:MAG: response regulator [bacterium]